MTHGYPQRTRDSETTVGIVMSCSKKRLYSRQKKSFNLEIVKFKEYLKSRIYITIFCE